MATGTRREKTIMLLYLKDSAPNSSLQTKSVRGTAESPSFVWALAAKNLIESSVQVVGSKAI